MVISEKSRVVSWRELYATGGEQLTLSVQKVADGNSRSFIGVDRGVFEHLLCMGLRTNSHVLLTKMLHLSVNAGMLLIIGKN